METLTSLSKPSILIVYYYFISDFIASGDYTRTLPSTGIQFIVRQKGISLLVKDPDEHIASQPVESLHRYNEVL